MGEENAGPGGKFAASSARLGAAGEERTTRLAHNVADVWWAVLDGFDVAQQKAALALLDATERVRYDAFKADGARLQYLAGRALVRTCLSRYSDIRPIHWRFRAGPYGRPFIDEGCAVEGLHFNLSHTEGLAVCVIAPFAGIGVDAERRDRTAGIEELAESVLAPSERAQLEVMTGSAYRERFLLFWTLKESYLKARGIGLAMPMNRIRFDLSAAAPSAEFDGSVGDDAGRWSFRLLELTAGHVVALSAAVPQDRLEIRATEASPICP